METKPVLEFTSHVEGRNARIFVYRDRIEWEKPRGVMAKLTSAATNGLLGAGSAGTNMIPMRQVTSVTTKRDGLINSKVCVITSGDDVEFRVSHDTAKAVKAAISQLLTEA